MATTTNYALNKPTVGASENTWGTDINNNFDSIDSLLSGSTPVNGIDIDSGTLNGVSIESPSIVGDITFNGITVSGLTATGLCTFADASFTGVTADTLGVASLINLPDGGEVRFGAGDDLRIFHTINDGVGNSYIYDLGEGSLFLGSNGAGIGFRSLDVDGNSNGPMLNMNAGGSVIAYYNGAKKLETSDTGVTVTGDLTATGDVTAYSDGRIKEDVNHIENALDKVMQLNGYTFTRIDSGEKQTGVIAQEVLEILPEAVKGSHEGGYSVAYGNMVGLLIEAIKELNKKL